MLMLYITYSIKNFQKNKKYILRNNNGKSVYFKTRKIRLEVQQKKKSGGHPHQFGRINEFDARFGPINYNCQFLFIN